MNITFIIGTLLIAFIFQKNPTIGIILLGIIIITKIPKKRKDPPMKKSLNQ